MSCFLNHRATTQPQSLNHRLARVTLMHDSSRTRKARTTPRTIVAPEQPAVERRRGLRYPSQLDGSCQRITDGDGQWPVQTIDMSARGIGLLVARRFEPGTLLSSSLTGVQGGISSLPLARVQRCCWHDPYWLLGCVWATELSTSELGSLVDKAALCHAGSEAARWASQARNA